MWLDDRGTSSLFYKNTPKKYGNQPAVLSRTLSFCYWIPRPDSFVPERLLRRRSPTQLLRLRCILPWTQGPPSPGEEDHLWRQEAIAATLLQSSPIWTPPRLRSSLSSGISLRRFGERMHFLFEERRWSLPRRPKLKYYLYLRSSPPGDLRAGHGVSLHIKH